MRARYSFPAVVAAPVGAVLIAMLFGTATARAQEYCVACAAPAALYRCVIDGAAPGQTQPLKVLCLTAMAREGGHESCSVRGGTVLDCDGPVKRVAAASRAAPSDPAQTLPSANPDPATAKAPPPAPSNPPKTVEEMVRRAAKSTGDGVGQAGSAVTDAAKKTWGCLASLFKSC